MNRAGRRAAAARGKAPPGRRIESVAAYFRNDGHQGIALSKVFDGGEGNGFASWCEERLVVLDAIVRPSDAIAWLEQVGRTFGIGRDETSMPQQLGHELIALIHWLERRGHIASDEYNGVLWVGVEADRTLFAYRVDEPSPERMRHLLAAVPNARVEALEPPDFERRLREVLGSPESN